jgi:hypothetical protein
LATITATAARMERELPAWQPFDPGEPGSGNSFNLDGGGGARVLVLLAGAGASEERWAAQAALDIARRLARASGRTLLADLDLRAASLHDLVGVTNDEGMSDVFLWGASFQRVAHPIEPGLLFVAAGTVVADASAVTGSARWDAVTHGFDRAGATLTLYAPHDADGLDRVLERASDVVVLATQEEALEIVPPAVEDRVRAILGPASTKTTVSPAEEAIGTEPKEPGWVEPAASESEGRRVVAANATKSVPPYVWLTVGMFVILAVILAAWAGWVNVPYLSPLLADRGEVLETSEGVEAVPEPAVAEPSATPASGEATSVTSNLPVQTFSLTIAAYPDAAQAASMVAELRARRPDVLFYLAPVEVEGRIFHRLLAGAATDRAGADVLRGSLAETFGPTNAERWILRDAGEAYLLGREATLTDAETRVEGLGARGIRAYVLEVPGDASGPFRVYAGGYAGPRESAVLGRMLDDAGLSGVELVDRVGLLPR